MPPLFSSEPQTQSWTDMPGLSNLYKLLPFCKLVRFFENISPITSTDMFPIELLEIAISSTNDYLISHEIESSLYPSNIPVISHEYHTFLYFLDYVGHIYSTISMIRHSIGLMFFSTNFTHMALSENRVPSKKKSSLRGLQAHV